MTRRTKARIRDVVSLIIISPILPFYALSAIARAVQAATDWCVQDRRWSSFLFRIAERVEMWAAR